jgi:hypothetical protein
MPADGVDALPYLGHIYPVGSLHLHGVDGSLHLQAASKQDETRAGIARLLLRLTTILLNTIDPPSCPEPACLRLGLARVWLKDFAKSSHP